MIESLLWYSLYLLILAVAFWVIWALVNWTARNFGFGEMFVKVTRFFVLLIAVIFVVVLLIRIAHVVLSNA